MRDKEIDRLRSRLYYETKRLEIIKALGGLCKGCGISDYRVLQIDHINGGGNAERKQLNQSAYHFQVLNNLAAYQLLCANCSWIKRHERKENCPRK